MNYKLGETLIKKKLVSKEQVDQAIEEKKKTGEFLGQILIRMGYIKEADLLNLLAEQLGIPYVKLKEIAIDEAAIKKVPPKFVWHYNIMPTKFDDNVLTIAVSDPMDMVATDDIEINLGYRVERVLAGKDDISWAIKEYYGVGADTIEKILDHAVTGAKKTHFRETKIDDIEKLAGDASVIKLVNQILQKAIRDEATDLHIEPFREEIMLRYRIDGILYETAVSEDIKYLYSSIVSRIKIMAGLDIVERHLPQDGRAKVSVGEKEYDLRVSILPSFYGEDVVIRILPAEMLFDLKKLGLTADDYKTLEGSLNKSYGIIFLTGPTGSGKTTTLYSCLNKLNTPQRKIITIEDPVEYELKGIHQIQVNPKINLTFARSLRSMLRHDPDILMVGEVRDTETAEIAIQASLTGHMVFSTLHTNDAASAATRLVDMGIEPYLIVSSVEVFIAQRLVRLICQECKEKSAVNTSLFSGKDLENKPLLELKQVYRGKGCEACKNTGYKGRTGIYEVLLLSEPIKELIMKKVSAGEIKRMAVSLGMKTLRDNGLEKVAEGITTLEEVMRVTQTGE